MFAPKLASELSADDGRPNAATSRVSHETQTARSGVGLMTAALLMVSVMSAFVLGQGGQRTFADEWTNKHVVLVREIYTLHFVAEGGLGTSPRQTNEPLVFVSPGQTIYRASINGKEMFDDDVDRLVGQVTTKIQSRSAGQKILGGSSNAQMKTGAVELSRYKPGEEFVITKVGFSKADVQFALAKPFDLKTVATGFVVRLDAPVSSDFIERANVEMLMAQIVKAK